MTIQPDEIYEHERSKWIAETSKRKSFMDWFSQSVPLLLLVIQAAMFWVSAKHTSDMINLIAPDTGLAGVIGFEVGLVVLSLLAITVSSTIRWWAVLEVIMVIMIVLSNIAGSLDAIVSTTGIKELSFMAVLAAFGGLRLTIQVGLIVGLAFAVAVPLLFVATGQAFARLIMDNAGGTEKKWQEHGYPFVYRAFYSTLISQGMRPTPAEQTARRLASGLFGKAKQVAETGEAQTGTQKVQTGTKEQQAKTLLADNPALRGLSLRVLAEKTGIDKTTWAEVKREVVPSNGKVHEEIK